MNHSPQPQSRTELEPELVGELRRRILTGSAWHRLTLVQHGGGAALRESLRPLLIRDTCQWQLETVREGRTTVRNLADAAELAANLERLIAATGPREYHLLANDGDLHLRVTRKGRKLVSRGKGESAATVVPQPHDRIKRQPLDAFDSAPLLRICGISDRSGRIKSSMRGKYHQINAFLRELEAVLPATKSERALQIVDCCSGLAYLTLATASYLHQAHGFAPEITGIERNPELVAKANTMARDLDQSRNVTFVAADLSQYCHEARPDLLLSLHACDEATDLALACGVEWGAEAILAAPCCQHDLQQQIGSTGPLRALLRHGILRERQADLLTDACRAQLLRILGYRVKIVEFVAPEATPRNLLLRATAGLTKGQGPVVEEYLALRDFWRITPALERLLAARLAPYFGHTAG